MAPLARRMPLFITARLSPAVAVAGSRLSRRRRRPGGLEKTRVGVLRTGLVTRSRRRLGIEADPLRTEHFRLTDGGSDDRSHHRIDDRSHHWSGCWFTSRHDLDPSSAQREEITAIPTQGETGNLDHGDMASRHRIGAHRADHLMEIGMRRTGTGNRRQTGLGQQLAEPRLSPRGSRGIAEFEHSPGENAEPVKSAGDRALRTVEARTRRTVEVRLLLGTTLAALAILTFTTLVAFAITALAAMTIAFLALAISTLALRRAHLRLDSRGATRGRPWIHRYLPLGLHRLRFRLRIALPATPAATTTTATTALTRLTGDTLALAGLSAFGDGLAVFIFVSLVLAVCVTSIASQGGNGGRIQDFRLGLRSRRCQGRLSSTRFPSRRGDAALGQDAGQGFDQAVATESAAIVDLVFTSELAQILGGQLAELRRFGHVGSQV